MSASNHKLPDLGAVHLDRDAAGRLTMTFGVLGGLGTLAILSQMFSEASRAQAFYSYLVAYVFVLTLALGGLFFVILQHLVAAKWSVVVRRIAEIIGSTLPVLAVLFLPLALGVHVIFPWAGHGHEAAHAPVLAAKAPYLNVPFFMIRAAVYLVIWSVLGTLMYRRSRKLDESGDPQILLGLRRLSAPAILLWALSLTFAGFDWVMSLEPEWYSTIFGVYLFAGSVVSSLALLALTAILLGRAGLLSGIITAEHYHDLGKLMFGFIVFWTYIAFSQFFLIWYSNIPEETGWYLHRWSGGWPVVAVLLVFGHFVVPFFMLLSRNAKRSRVLLALVCPLLIAIHYVDLYFLVMPALHKDDVAVHWLDGAALAGLGGLFVALVARGLGRAPLVPIKDPFLPDSMEFENV